MKTFLKPLSKEEESLCIQALRDEDAGRSKEAKQLLIERNLRLVAHIAKKYASSEEGMEDLISIGTIGLIKAVDTFDPEKNNRLAAYAARCIGNAILSQMRLLFQTSTLRAIIKMACFGASFRENESIRKAGVQSLAGLLTCFLFCGCDDSIQQFHLLIGWTIQFFDILIDHICVDTGNSFR